MGILPNIDLANAYIARAEGGKSFEFAGSGQKQRSADSVYRNGKGSTWILQPR